MSELPLITALTMTPLIGGILLLGLSGENKILARRSALGFAVFSLLLVLFIWNAFDSTSTELQFVEKHAWIPTLGVHYFVGLDGLGLLMILLAAIVTPIAILASWKNGETSKTYYSMLLLLQSGFFGTFTANPRKTPAKITSGN